MTHRGRTELSAEIPAAAGSTSSALVMTQAKLRLTLSRINPDGYGEPDAPSSIEATPCYDSASRKDENSSPQGSKPNTRSKT
jgi:hypothetical protein